MTQERAGALARIEDIDRRDELQIMQHMSGELVTEYVYGFVDSDGRKQKGLSWAGIRELAQLLGNIEVEQLPHVDLRDDGDGRGPYYRVICRATDRRRGVTVLGGVHEHVNKPRRDGGTYENPHAFTVALSKAQRNAIKNLVPVSIVHTMVEKMEQLQSGQITHRQARVAVDRQTGEIHQRQVTSAPQEDRQPPSSDSQDAMTRFWAGVRELGKSPDDVSELLGAPLSREAFDAYIEREGLSSYDEVLERLREAG